jgi:thiol-disulfide isomerase/thioredoxin
LTLIFLGVIGAALLLGWILAPADPGGAAVGSTAPEISMDVFDGSSWTLSGALDAGAGPLVVNLWASWCAPCKEEIPELSDFAERHPDVMVVGVAVQDRPEDARMLAAELAPSYPMGVATSDAVTGDYAVIGLPATFVIDGDGALRLRFDRQITAADLESAIESLR